MPIAMGKQVEGLKRNDITWFEVKISCLLLFAHGGGGTIVLDRHNVGLGQC